MPSLQIQVGVEHHLTLIKFDTLEPESPEYLAVLDIMRELMKKVKTSPNGSFGSRAMFGPYHNVAGIRIVSTYIDQCRGFIISELEARGIPFSTKYEWNPHVTRPLPDWVPGSEVPFATFAQLTMGKIPRDHFELIGLSEGTGAGT